MTAPRIIGELSAVRSLLADLVNELRATRQQLDTEGALLRQAMLEARR